jgi:K+-sensing histidine kinase KdpD
MREQAEHRGIDLNVRLQPAETSGDARLAERLISNLIDNAVRHNHRRGRIDVRTLTKANRSVVSVANSGPIVLADEIERLFQPFQRLGTTLTDDCDGIGLGLSIVKAVAAAHDATLTVQPQPNGGLQIEVAFPQPVTTSGNAAHPSRARATFGRAIGSRRRSAGRDESGDRPHARAETSVLREPRRLDPEASSASRADVM